VALDDAESNGVRRSVSQVVIHPTYDGSRLPEGDVALLEVIKVTPSLDKKIISFLILKIVIVLISAVRSFANQRKNPSSDFTLTELQSFASSGVLSDRMGC
jgi:hypothetical protein